MVGDPNWLYSTIAQSSAAIVAIVGGFITASVLMLLAEKRSLTNQRADKESRLSALKFEEKEAFETYETMRVNEFFDAIASELSSEEELPTPEVLIQRYPQWNLDYEILKRQYAKLSKQRLEAKYFITEHSDKIDPTQFLVFDDWVKANKLDISPYDYKLLEDEYNKCRDRKIKILEEEKRKATPPLLRGILNMKLPLIRPLTPELTAYRLYERQREDKRLEDIEGRISSLRHEIFLLESEVANLDALLSTFSYPPNLGWGIVVLGYLAVFGILFPVLVIWKEAYSDLAKTLTTFLFYIGIIGIFAYIVFQIRALRRK